MEEEVRPIVMDVGSGSMKIGYGGDDTPLTFPSCIGRPKYPRCMVMPFYDKYYGNSAMSHRGILTMNYPIKRGIMMDLEDTMGLWEEAYRQIGADSSQHPLLTTEHMGKPLKNSEMMIENMFERFHVPAGYIAVPGVLSCYSCGTTTAMILESGDGITQVLPVYFGHVKREAVIQTDIGGRDITDYLSKLIKDEADCYLNSTAEWEIVRGIKENLCFTSEDYRQQIYDWKKKGNKREYQLPDGNVIKLGRSLFQAPEIMFNPKMIGMECEGVVEMIKASIAKSDIDLRECFVRNIVLGGANTCFPGFENRLKNELSAKREGSPFNRVRATVVASPERNYSAWIGGSILSSLTAYQSLWISREEYDESGPNIVHMKCLF